MVKRDQVELTEKPQVPLRGVLDPNVTYVWVASVNQTTGCADIVLGYEHIDEQGNRYGHPTLTVHEDATGTHRTDAFIGGELSFRGHGWHIDNDSGRYGRGNPTQMRQMGIDTKDLLRAVAGMITAKTDLRIESVIPISPNPIKRYLQKHFAFARRGYPTTPPV